MVSVSFTNSDGTATQGADYGLRSGVRTFTAGDTADKTLTFPIIDDTDVEGNETVRVALLNPDGGATLGTQNTALLTIVDNDRPASVMCHGRVATIVGTPGNDTLNGTSGANVIHGRGGNDVIRGYRGNDVICGGNGDDRLLGGSGDDRLLGERGNDYTDGGRGSDVCEGGPHTTCDRAVNCERIRDVP